MRAKARKISRPSFDGGGKRVVIVDDHPLVRRGLAKLISDQSDLELIGEASDAGEAITLIADEKPDLVVIDISLSDMSGLELIKQVKARDPDVKMLVSSMHDESLYAERALRAGAMGYVNKSEAPDKVIDAIRTVLGGNMHLSSQMTDRMLRRVAHGDDVTESTSIDTLSDRELEVFDLIGEALTTREIAERLHLSPKTVETYREHIKDKLNLKNSNELVQHAVTWKLQQQGMNEKAAAEAE